MRHLLLTAAFTTVLGSTLTAFAGTTTPIDLRSRGTLTLAVYGDAPYGTSPTDTTQLNLTPAFINAINQDSLVDLVVHVGDIHSGKQYCTSAYDLSVYDVWTAFKQPLVYTPGDNEWTDCHKVGEGGGSYDATTGQIKYVLDANGNPVDYAGGDPIANLALVRTIFFSIPGSTLGAQSKAVLTQAATHDPAHPSDAKYVENVIWAQSQTLFVTINLPGGSNNDNDIWYSAPSMSSAQSQEIQERTGADLRWLDSAFAIATANNLAGVVIFAQADMWDAEKGAAHQAAYEPFIQNIAAHTTAFGKPVLMLNGDSHVYQSSNPLDPSDSLFAQRLLFTAELGSSGGVWQSTLAFPPTVEDISGAFGRGGYEGIQDDSSGNVWVIEDSGGSKGAVNTHARQPNSFVYRFVPKQVGNLKQGKLQALQVISLRSGQPIAFHAGQADADILSPDVADLHTYGKVFDTHWVTLHDTDVEGFGPFDANARAKAKLATPFKRPENGQFRPGMSFTEFYFDETGDTDSRTEAGSAYGGFGSVMKLVQTSPAADSGKLRPFFVCDIAHSGFDNVAFWSKNDIVFVEDAGDTLHTQRNALDSAYVFDVELDYSNPSNQPLRVIAEGRDPSATIDSALSGQPGFQNDGDNEITGMHASNGDATTAGILGAQVPKALRFGWRVFYTAQHGDNVTWELLPKP